MMKIILDWQLWTIMVCIIFRFFFFLKSRNRTGSVQEHHCVHSNTLHVGGSVLAASTVKCSAVAWMSGQVWNYKLCPKSTESEHTPTYILKEMTGFDHPALYWTRLTIKMPDCSIDADSHYIVVPLPSPGRSSRWLLLGRM